MGSWKLFILYTGNSWFFSHLLLADKKWLSVTNSLVLLVLFDWWVCYRVPFCVCHICPLELWLCSFRGLVRIEGFPSCVEMPSMGLSLLSLMREKCLNFLGFLEALGLIQDFPEDGYFLAMRKKSTCFCCKALCVLVGSFKKPVGWTSFFILQAWCLREVNFGFIVSRYHHCQGGRHREFSIIFCATKF